MVIRVSSKDFTSTVAVAYVVYKLLCLTDPARYYGKPSGDAIDIMNVAINANQARNVFFKGFKSKIEKSPWFAGKFSAKTEYIEFKKAITVYSGHSERESHEGLNLFMAVLDEISGFAIESSTGHALSKTGDAIYKAFRGTVDSRFPDLGKVVLLSFPRFKEDYISQKYNECIADKDVIMRSHTFKINDDLPDGLSENEFTITWEEDHIAMYSLPKVFALKRPTWEVNPTRKIEDFRNAFYSDPDDALQRFACMPPEAEGGYFKDHAKIDSTFCLPPPIEEGLAFQDWFRPKDETRYFMHVDLAQKNDRCAVAMAHVDSWIHTAYVMGNHYYDPVIVVDFVYWWTPTKDQSVNFDDVRDFIVGVKRSGFDVRAVTFDRWQCLVGDSVIPTTNGFKSIIDVVAEDVVATSDGQEAVSHVYDNDVRKTLNVKTKFGFELSGTLNHPILTQNGFVNIGDLKVGTKIAIKYSNIFSDKELISPEIAEVLGFALGDGYMYGNQLSVDSIDREVLVRLQSTLSDNFVAMNTSIKTKKIQRQNHQQCYRLYFSSKEFGSFVDKYAPSLKLGSREKDIPDAIMQSSRSVQIAFLRGLFDAEGHIGFHSSGWKVDIEMTSKNIIDKTHLMLTNLGILGAKWSRVRKPHGAVHRISIRGERALPYLKQIGFISNRKVNATQQYLSEFEVGRKLRWNWNDDGIAWLPIESITDNGMHRVYDMTVPDSHSFIANGIVTHNSHTMMMELNALGINSEKLSVAKKHYDDFKMALMQDHVRGPDIELLRKELKQLRIIKDKVDHPRQGGKDLADATCGAVFNAISRTPRDDSAEVVVMSLSDKQRTEQSKEQPNKIIAAPPKMPAELKEYLGGLKLI